MLWEIDGPTLSCSAIRMMDTKAIEKFGIPGIVLMENAGLWTSLTALEMLGWNLDKKVVIFCGKGNNGGDGFVVARHLHNRGLKVQVCVVGGFDEVREGSDAATNLAIIRKMGISCRELLYQDGKTIDYPSLLEEFADCSLVVDALLGTGAKGELRHPYGDLIALINSFPFARLAVDIPSGLDGDTGETLQPVAQVGDKSSSLAVRAHTTVTFGAYKVGFYKERGPEFCGEVILVDIGLPSQVIPEV